VIIFEPFFDLYFKQSKLTGADVKCVKLGGENAPADDPWALDIDKLEAAITDKTKILILNSPHNPTGKVFTEKENKQIAALMEKYPDIMIFSDEVYKYTVYNPNEAGDEGCYGHSHFAKLPGMYDRTLTLSSSGKTFSITGWQIGWLVGPEALIKPIQAILPCVQFCPSTVMQQALANALPTANGPYEGAPTYFEWLRGIFATKRAILEEGFEAIGIKTMPSNGGFFVMAKLPELDVSDMDHLDEPYDWKLCRKIAKDYNIIGIPASSFFLPGYEKEFGPMARFAMCKTDDTLREASRRMIEGAAKIAEGQ
jgi:kynurenine--oxoglutarate transaminase/cysteine-S-conjugate beta-lyase/glutamine--phenylpyruvate transaminase